MSGSDFFDDDLVQRRGAAKAPLGQGVDVVGSARDELPARPISDLNLTRMTKHREEMNAQVATAKVEIERLKRRQTDLEREKQTLEDLSAKQDQYEKGKQEMMDRLTELYSAIRRRHGDMLQELQGIQDSRWPEETFRDELNKALVLVEGARKEFVKSQAAVEAEGGPASLAAPVVRRLDGGPVASGLPAGFGTWLKVGFAVSLPLIVALALAVVLLLIGNSIKF